MIHYQLRCAAGHEFDGWFKDSTAFEAQAAQHLLACPRCGHMNVTRAMMAPHIGKAAAASSEAAPGPHSTPAEARPPQEKSGHERPDRERPGPEKPDRERLGRERPGRNIATLIPDEMRAVLSRLRSEIEQRCDYVGRDFASEARRIHDGETAAHGIYGEASPAEVEALAEDGIEIARIPWVPRTDS